MKVITTETVVETLTALRIVHVTDNRKHSEDTYELRTEGGSVTAWAHRTGAVYAVNVGDPQAPLPARRFVGLAPTADVALSALRKIARG